MWYGRHAVGRAARAGNAPVWSGGFRLPPQHTAFPFRWTLADEQLFIILPFAAKHAFGPSATVN